MASINEWNLNTNEKQKFKIQEKKSWDVWGNFDYIRMKGSWQKEIKIEIYSLGNTATKLYIKI